MKLPSNADPVLQQVVGEIDREFQRQSHKSLARAPKSSEIPENGFVIANISGTLYIYTRVGQQLYRSPLIAV